MFSSSPYWPATDSHPSSTSSSPSTLVDVMTVSPDDLPKLVSGKISPQVIDYLVDRVYDAVDFGLNRPSSSSPTSNRCSASRSRTDPERKAFTDFVATVLRRAEATLPAVIGALVYIDRARPHLSIAIEEWALHRVFLGALIVASKYLNDASLKNAHWALCTGVFGRRDVQRIEREFLDVLAWDLAVTEADLVRTCSRMAREGVLICPHMKTASPISPAKEAKMEVDENGAETRSRKLSNGSLRMVRALWDEARRRQAQLQHSIPRPEKRAQADVDMEVDHFEERARRRRSVYPSPTSSDGSSTCTASSSPATDSDDSNSPCTPPPSHQAPASLGHFAVPGSAVKSIPHPLHTKSASNGSMNYQPLALLDAFPSVPPPPVPTPALALKPVRAPHAPPPLPCLPPYPAYPLHRAFPASHTHHRPHSARPASPYTKPSLSAGSVTGSHPRSMTPYTHRRSSALSSMPMEPSLYPAYIPAMNT